MSFRSDGDTTVTVTVPNLQDTWGKGSGSVKKAKDPTKKNLQHQWRKHDLGTPLTG